MLLVDINRCDLCGGEHFVDELTVNEWRLVRCMGCGLVFTSPRYSAEALAELYAGAYYQGAHGYYQSQLTPPSSADLALARTIAKTSHKRGGKSVDIGCGTGRMVEALGAAGFRAAGVEPNKMAAEAGRSLGRNISEADLSALDSGAYDCVTAFHVLEHASSPRAFLEECRRILSPRGLLVVEVPNYGSSVARRQGALWQPLYPDTHLYQFTPDTLQAYLRDLGFRPVSVRKVGGGGLLGPEPDRPDGRAAGNEVIKAPLRPIDIVKSLVWRSRSILYAVPYAREFTRFVYWHLLDQGEFVRIMAVKSALPDSRPSAMPD